LKTWNGKARALWRNIQKKTCPSSTTFGGENYSINVGQFSLFTVRQHNIAVVAAIVAAGADHHDDGGDENGGMMMRLLMLCRCLWSANYCSFH